jgi:Ulp1 family protease
MVLCYLGPERHINTDVIDSYMNMLQATNSGEDCVFFTLEFSLRVNNNDMPRMRVHTDSRKRRRYINIFTKKALFMPFHVPGHWVLIVVYPQEKKICYFDSMYSVENATR